MDVVQDALLVLAAYLVGSVPAAYIVGRVVKGIDLREYGSGNLGGSNVWEHVGKWWVLPIGVFDFLIKGTAIVAVVRYGFDESLMVQVSAALASAAGHNWSPYIKFTGGRGISVGLGSLVLLSWQNLAILVGFALVGKVVFRHTGLAVVLGVLALPVFSSLMYGFAGDRLALVVFGWGLLGLTVLKRALTNKPGKPRGVSWRRLLWNRILYDRDVSRREEWVRRIPLPKP